jgi:hypothetical protein
VVFRSATSRAVEENFQALQLSALGPPYLFGANRPVGVVDNLGLQWIDPRSIPTRPTRPVPPDPYTIIRNSNGLFCPRVVKCNVVILYGHGVNNWKSLTIKQKNGCNLPGVVLNESCSAAEVYGCYSGNYVSVQTPTEGAENPTTDVNVNTQIDELWQRARAQAKAICRRKDSCCKEVTITFENRLPIYFRSSAFFFHPTQSEVVKCN